MDNPDSLEQHFNNLMHKLEKDIAKFNYRERFIATEWVNRLKSANNSIEVMRLRNIFIEYFAEGGPCVFRSAPFNNVPPNVSLQAMSCLLPSSCSVKTMQDKQTQYLCELFDSLPDKGDFLAQQPVPRDGTFYILIMRPS